MEQGSVHRSHPIDLAVHQVGLGAVVPVVPGSPSTPPAPPVSIAASKSPTTVAAIAAAAVVGVVLLVKVFLVYSTGREIVTTGKSAAAWAKQKRDEHRLKVDQAKVTADQAKANPLNFSSTGGRIVAYRVRLGCDPLSETVIFRRDGRAVLVRQAVPIVMFRPTEYQSAKIRSGIGEILIFTDQL